MNHIDNKKMLSGDDKLVGEEMRCGECYLSEKELSQKGSITWFRCEDQLPPIGEEDLLKKCRWSDMVLITDGKNIAQGFYVYDLQGFSHKEGNWQPTHWSYINYPE